MAKIGSQHVIITINKLVKDGDNENINILGEDILAQLEEVVTQLIDDAAVVVEVKNG